MFRQILVASDDRKYQNIFCRNNPVDPLQAYELNTVKYGTACAPYLANRVILQLAKDEGKNNPLIAPILQHDTYVDVFLGAEDLILLKTMRNQLIKVTSTAGLTLRKWSSNTPELLHDLNKDEHSLAIPSQSDANLQVLRICWNPQSDCFKFKINFPISDSPTKRSVLSCIAKFFNPLGWLAPIIILAKILLQSLWMLHMSLDKSLPENVIQTWSQFYESLSRTADIVIPRCIHFGNNVLSMELRGFSDASKQAYAAVIYARVVTFTGETYVHLITAKTKVAPIKILSIARLQLCVATLLAKLITSVQTILRIPDSKLFCWTNSMIVLCWLQKQPSHWTVFVANRVSFIQTTVSNPTWRYVPSKENPADCASRGKAASELSQFSLWWNGPNWLSLSSEFRLQEKMKVNEILEERESVNVHNLIITWDLLYRFSSWARLLLLRVSVYILRFINALRKRPITTKFLTSEEISLASEFWIRYAQKQEFNPEIISLSSKGSLQPNSKLQELKPFLDSLQILRLGGRLKHANQLSSEQKYCYIPSGWRG